MSTDYPKADDGTFRPLRVCDMGADQRPRERMLTHGARALSDADLLAILLGGGLPGLPVVDLAKQMLQEADNRLTMLARMPISELTRRFRGVGQAKAVTVAAAFELGSRLRRAMEMEAADKSLLVLSSNDAYRFIRHRLDLLDHEEFWVMALSRSNRVLSSWCVSNGGISMTVVDVRLLLRRALGEAASALILVHNHPSGNLQPSVEDDRLTRKIADGAKMLDIQVADHLIIVAGNYYSYRDQGRLLTP